MLKLLLGVVGVEVNVVLRRAATTALLFVIGALLLGGALFGGMLAIFIALAETYDPLIAALLITAIFFAAGAIVLVIAYARLRRRRRVSALSSLGAVTASAPLANRPLGPAMPLLSSRTVIGVAAIAAVVGLILGRRI